MNFVVEQYLRSSFIWKNIGLPLQSNWKNKAWLKRRCPAPVPHAVKVRNIMAIADLFSIEVLIETGTYKGQMVDATLDRFKKIYSIEVFSPLAAAAQRKYSENKSVTILPGDSATVLPSILKEVQEPALFWLDGHFSGKGTGLGLSECPIRAEIDAILELRKSYRDAIIIDDARCFVGSGDFPSLPEYLSYLRKGFGVEPLVANDAIFILPSYSIY